MGSSAGVVIGTCSSSLTSGGGLVPVGSEASGTGRLNPCNIGDMLCLPISGARLSPLDPPHIVYMASNDTSIGSPDVGRTVVPLPCIQLLEPTIQFWLKNLLCTLCLPSTLPGKSGWSKPRRDCKRRPII